MNLNFSSMSFNATRENKILAKISGFTVKNTLYLTNNIRVKVDLLVEEHPRIIHGIS